MNFLEQLVLQNIPGDPTSPVNGGLWYNTTTNKYRGYQNSALVDLISSGSTVGGDLTGSYPSPSIATGAVSLAKMANLATGTIIGNNSGSTGVPLALTSADVTAMLSQFSTITTTKGLVPGSNGVGSTYFLNADGSWSIPAGGVTSLSATSPITASASTGSVTISTSMNTNKLIGRSTSSTGVMEEITLGTGLSFSGTTLNASGASPLTTKGDIFVRSTVDTRLPVGTDGQILTANSSVAQGLSWQDNYADWTSVVKHTVKNDGTSLITKGTAVYSTGSNGTNILVGKASNTSEPTSSKTMGLMQSDITTTGGTQTGFVVTEGLLGGLNTAAATAGDPVWLGVSGALIYGLINKPYAPAHLVFIGIVTKVGAGNGEIFVKVQNGFELKEIHDVQAQSPSNKDTLYYDSASTQWKTDSIPNILGSASGDLTGTYPGPAIANGAVTLPKMANLTAHTIIGNNTGTSVTPLALSGTQVTAMLDVFDGTTKGLVPVPSGPGTNVFLAADSTWQKIATSAIADQSQKTLLANITASSGAVSAVAISSITTELSNVVGDSGSGGTKGLVPAPLSGDATAGKFLKADGTWAVPAGGGGGTPSSYNYITSTNFS